MANTLSQELAVVVIRVLRDLPFMFIDERARRGITLRQASKEIGVSYTVLHAMEQANPPKPGYNGKDFYNYVPSLPTAEAVLEWLADSSTKRSTP